MPILIIRSEGQSEERVPLESSAVTLGRAIDADVRLQDIRLSRKHCQIVATPEGYAVVDLGSGNGTKVNGVRIKEHKLKPGDVILIGATTILYSDDESRPVAQPSPKPAPKPVAPSPHGPAPRAPSKEDVRRAEMPTQMFPKAGETSAMKTPRPSMPAGQKSGGATPTSARMPGARPGASSRYLATSKKKIPTKYLLIGGGAAVVLFVIIVILSSGGPSISKILREAEDAKVDVEVLEKAEKFPDAISRCDEGLEKLAGITGNKDVDHLRKWFRGRKTILEGKIRDEADALARCREIDAELEKIPVAQKNLDKLSRLHEKAKGIKSSFPGVTKSMLKEIEAVIARTLKAYEGASKNPTADDYAAVREQVSPLLRARNYGEAVRLWNEFVLKHGGEEEAKTAKETIESINKEALAFLEDLKQRVEARVTEDKGKAVRYLEENREKFKGTAAEPGFESLFRDISSR